jgi:hypothetical protein
MREYEKKYGYVVPPYPDWKWHLRWMLPVFLLLAGILALPVNQGLIYSADDAACTNR